MTPVIVDRLRDGRDVVATLRARTQRAGSTVVVHARPSGRPSARLTVLASRRVGNAVERNRAKRVLRAAAHQLAWAPGFDLVLVARRATGAAGSTVVRDELQRLGDQLGVLTTKETVR